MAEAGGRLLDLARHVAVEHVVAEFVERRRRDEDVVLDDLAVLEADLFLFQVDEIDRLIELVVAFEGLGEAAIELTGAAEEGELELVVGAPAEVVAAQDDVLERAVDVEDGDAFADPFLVHQFRFMRPDLEVVGLHEVFGDAVAEDGVYELVEVFRALVIALGLGLDEAGQAFELLLLGEITDVVLERVWDPGLEHAHPALAHVHLEVVAHQFVEDVVVVFVVAEHDVAADVPGETGGVGVTARQAAQVGQAVVHHEIGVAHLLEAVCRPQAGRTGPDDDNLFLLHDQHPFAVQISIQLFNSGLRALRRHVDVFQL